MSLCRWFTIFLCFAVEIRVKAAVQEPPRCLATAEKPCSLFTSRPSVMKTADFELSMQAGSIIYRDVRQQWNFLSGTIRVATPKVLKINTRVGRLQLNPGIHWIQWREEKLWVYAIEGEAVIDLTASPLAGVTLVAGTYNWFGAIDRQGQNQVGIPRALEDDVLKTVLVGFAKHPDRSLVKKRVSRSIAMVSEFYKEIAQKMVQDSQEKQRAIEFKENQRRQFEKGLRDRFRSKYLGPVDLDEVQ